jgi:hypothetical protein
VDGGEGEKRWNQVFIKSPSEIGNAVENVAVTMSFVNDDDLVLEVDAERLSSGWLKKKVVWQRHELVSGSENKPSLQLPSSGANLSLCNSCSRSEVRACAYYSTNLRELLNVFRRRLSPCEHE